MLVLLVPLALLPRATPGAPAGGPGMAQAAELADAAAAAGGGSAKDSTVTAAGQAPVTPPQDGQGHVNDRSTLEPRTRELSRAEAVALVQHRYHARVVRTHLLQDAQGHTVYEFRLLSAGGKVWTVRIDAYSGTELP
ncbi:MAG TPA: PepSY domain-containing protein [Steroidobacteraceae bacterium]|nr:PepSY domain-containing protein [Steroidobacteraceae bacterium]